MNPLIRVDSHDPRKKAFMSVKQQRMSLSSSSLSACFLSRFFSPFFFVSFNFSSLMSLSSPTSLRAPSPPTCRKKKQNKQKTWPFFKHIRTSERAIVGHLLPTCNWSIHTRKNTNIECCKISLLLRLGRMLDWSTSKGRTSGKRVKTSNHYYRSRKQ